MLTVSRAAAGAPTEQQLQDLPWPAWSVLKDALMSSWKPFGPDIKPWSQFRCLAVCLGADLSTDVATLLCCVADCFLQLGQC
jgi:hypothetical protein